MQKDGSYPNECDKEDTFKAGNMKWSSPLVLKKIRAVQQYLEDKEESKESKNDVEGDSEVSKDEEYQMFGFLQHYIVCSIQDEADIQNGWILLDSQSK